MLRSEDIAPPAPTNQGEPLTLLEQIKLGKTLRKVKTLEKGAKLLPPTSSTLLESLPGENKNYEKSVNPLTDALSKGYDKIKSKMIKAGSDEFEGDIMENPELGGWNEDDQTTPTNKINEIVDSPRSDKAELGIITENTEVDKSWKELYKGKNKKLNS